MTRKTTASKAAKVSAAGKQKKSSKAVVADFVRSATFAGAKPGYAFRTGDLGLGYYPLLSSANGGGAAAGGGEREDGGEGDGEEDDDDDDDDDDDAARPPAPSDSASSSDDDDEDDPERRQRDLLREAFAADGALAEREFEEAKQRDVDAELPPTAEAGGGAGGGNKNAGAASLGVMPGWGTWASSQREPRWATEAKEKARRERERAAMSRRDARLKSVVVCERHDRRHAERYQAAALPWPFTSAEAYAASMRRPLGRDANPDAAFRDLTRPAVIKQTGVVIDPLRLPRGGGAGGGKKVERGGEAQASSAAAGAAGDYAASAKGRARAIVLVTGGQAVRGKVGGAVGAFATAVKAPPSARERREREKGKAAKSTQRGRGSASGPGRGGGQGRGKQRA